MRCAVVTSTKSPAAWPSESLICLKRSRSIWITASRSPFRAAAASSVSKLPRMKLRLFRPVNPSWAAMKAMELRASTNSLVRRRIISVIGRKMKRATKPRTPIMA